MLHYFLVEKVKTEVPEVSGTKISLYFISFCPHYYPRRETQLLYLTLMNDMEVQENMSPVQNGRART